MTSEPPSEPSAAPPRVSVVLPVYNRAAVVARAAQSVLDQTWRDLELVIVDDGSTDESLAVVEGLRDPRVRVIRRGVNRGGGAARNTGIAAARGALVAFQDSDDLWRPEKLERQLQRLDSSEGVGVVYTGFVRIEGGAAVYSPSRRVHPREGDLRAALLEGNLVTTASLLVQRHLLDTVGGFDERFPRFQDWELAIRLARHTDFALVDEPLVEQRDTPGCISDDLWAGVRARQMIFEKFEDEIRGSPRLQTAHHRSLGHLLCKAGDLRAGRREFLEGLRLSPGAVRIWAGLGVSLVGQRGYRRTFDLLRRRLGMRC